eukprot:CAMPEP_0119264908 /NCGR_PEP_ID=MMETSP1329-20130426/3860_1 /TAXON_ID=114041 /ORGANISM="Genus nov. species nov., Strain RCC1024" /LENGTH=194 /DNA_ID=CAMNT_0007264701 /DNA_START=242 /DNA_END=823 /DNA_ORIENTATION=+
MGISPENILSEPGHWSDFTCAVCQEVAEQPVILECTHVFCEFCLGEYVARCLDARQPSSCPTCRAAPCERAEALVKANPLAGRIYNRVQCRCPLAKQGCAWTGDVANLQDHLTNSEEHMGLKPAASAGANPLSTYDALKTQGDQKYQIRAYGAAADIYAKAIAVAPERAPAYANRAACRLMEHRYEECVADCDE